MRGCHGATRPAPPAPTEAPSPPWAAGAQRRWTSTSARSSSREPSASTSRSAPPVEAAAQQPLGLAEHPVDAEPDVAAWRSRPCRRCRAAARRPGRSDPRTHGNSASGDQARGPGPRCRRTVQRPEPAASGRPAGARPCRPRRPGGQVEREVDRGGEALVPVLAEQVVVGGRQELGGRQRARAARRTRRTAAARGCRPARPCRRRRRRRRRGGPPCSRAGDDEVAGERRAAGRAQRGLGVPARRGSSGCTPWPRIRSRRSTSIDSPSAPADAEPRPPERREQHDEAEHEEDQRPSARCAACDAAACRAAPPSADQHEHHEPRQLAAAEEQARRASAAAPAR